MQIEIVDTKYHRLVLTPTEARLKLRRDRSSVELDRILALSKRIAQAAKVEQTIRGKFDYSHGKLKVTMMTDKGALKQTFHE